MPKYLPGADPFMFPGNQIGCLLIHGFTGTPYEMRELGERLAGQGYTVYGPTLAGHATCLEDMQTTRWLDWYASVVTAYDELREHCDIIFPIGLSLGALLAMHLAVHRPVDAVVAAAPPFGIQHWLLPYFRALPLLFRIFPYVSKNSRDDDTQDPTVQSKHPSYPAHPTRCAASLILGLIPHLQKELGSIQVPTLLIQSRGDRTIPLDSIERFASHLGSEEKEVVWLEKGGHLVLEDYGKEQAFATIIAFLQKHIPEPIVVTQRQNAAVGFTPR